MKISVITICFNNQETISKCLSSVQEQTYSDIEHIVIDGASNDGTTDIIKSFEHVTQFISEPDKGIYNALNKGLKLVTGDVIGFLHSDDVFVNSNIISKIAQIFRSDESLDGIYGDIEFVNTSGKRVRYYSSANFKVTDFSYGKMPAHTSFFARNRIYQEFHFKEDYRIAADYDHLLRVFLSKRFKIEYKPILTTKMLTGGASTKDVKARKTINKEIIRSCRENGVKTNVIKVYSKYFKKIFELTH